MLSGLPISLAQLKARKKFEQPDKVLKILNKIIDFNKQIQEGLGLNILTPNQLLSRLSISLAQCI